MRRSYFTKSYPTHVPVVQNNQPGLQFTPHDLAPLKKRRVLIFSSIFFPHVFGGAEVAAYNRARLLAQRGHDVSVITLQEKNTAPSWGTEMAEGYKLYRIKTPRKYTLFERTQNSSSTKKLMWHLQDYFDRRNQNLVGDVIDAVQPDHIEIDNLIGLGFNALTEIGRRNLPVVYILHDLNLACFKTGMFREEKNCQRQCGSCKLVGTLRQAPLKKIKRLGFISPSQANLDKAKAFVPVINQSLSAVIKNVPEEIPELPPRLETDHLRLLYVGRLDPVKGVDMLLEQLDRLSHAYDFKLTILGTGPSEEALKKKYGDKSWVSFRGFVHKRHVASALINSDLYCIPSLVSESYGLVTAQALQLGTPVIGSAAGGTAELVRNGITGKLVPPGDAKAWYCALEKVLSQPELIKKWQKNAAAYSAEFNEHVIGRAYEDFVEKLSTDPVEHCADNDTNRKTNTDTSRPE